MSLDIQLKLKSILSTANVPRFKRKVRGERKLFICNDASYWTQLRYQQVMRRSDLMQLLPSEMQSFPLKYKFIRAISY